MKNKNEGMNDNTYKLLFEDIHNLPENERGTYANAIALTTIDRFTKIQEKRVFTKLLKMVYKKANIDINKITFNEDIKQFEYKDNDRIITFDRLSDHFEDENIVNELMSNKRYEKCHSKSIEMSQGMQGSKIVTGYITIGDSKILHSIIEYELEGETIILDWSRNLQISKKQYVELTNFVELSSFYGKEVIDDFELLADNIVIDTKVYATFRNEIMKDIKKNLQIFKPIDEEKKSKKEIREDEENSR